MGLTTHGNDSACVECCMAPPDLPDPPPSNELWGDVGYMILIAAVTHLGVILIAWLVDIGRHRRHKRLRGAAAEDSSAVSPSSLLVHYSGGEWWIPRRFLRKRADGVTPADRILLYIALFQVLLSFFTCTLFVYRTFSRSFPLWMQWAEGFCAVVFACYTVLRITRGGQVLSSICTAHTGFDILATTSM